MSTVRDNAPNWRDVLHNRENDPMHHIVRQTVFMLKTHSPEHKDMSHEDIYNSAVSYADSILNPENQTLPTP